MTGSSSFRLDGRNVLITGSGTGIGLDMATIFCQQGARVLLHGLASQREEGLKTASRIGAAGWLTSDFSSPDGADRLADEALEALGTIDILVLNAAVDDNRDWHAIERSYAEAMIGINLLAPLRLIQRLAPAMAGRGWGRVLLLGSVQQHRPHPQKLVYAGVKAAIENMGRNLAKQMAHQGVTVNTLAPGAIETALNQAALAEPAYRAAVLARIPARRLGTPADCAGAALFLCSDAASYITGVSLLVDGGMAL